MSATTLQLGVWAGTVIVRESGNSSTTVTLCTGGGVKTCKPLVCYYKHIRLDYGERAEHIVHMVRLVNNFGGISDIPLAPLLYVWEIVLQSRTACDTNALTFSNAQSS